MQQRQITIVVAVIRNEKSEILIAKRNEPEVPEIHDKWEFLGGGIEFGESPTDALKREVKEEAGIEVEVIRLLPEVLSGTQEFADKNLHVIILSYECKIISGTPTPKDSEIAELKFVALDEVQNYQGFDNLYQTAKLLKS